MALIDSRILRATIAGSFGVAAFAVCIAGWWASTYMLPIWDVKKAVRGKLADAESATFEHVSFSKASRVGCGYVSARNRTDGNTGKRHFILFPNGDLRFEPPAATNQGDTSHQIAALQKQASYAALIESNCFR